MLPSPNALLHNYTSSTANKNNHTKWNFIKDILINHSFENLPALEIFFVHFIVDGLSILIPRLFGVFLCGGWSGHRILQMKHYNATLLSCWKWCYIIYLLFLVFIPFGFLKVLSIWIVDNPLQHIWTEGWAWWWSRLCFYRLKKKTTNSTHIQVICPCWIDTKVILSEMEEKKTPISIYFWWIVVG